MTLKRRVVDADVPYLTGLIGLCAGFSTSAIVALHYGVEMGLETSDVLAAAMCGGFTVACILGGIVLIEMEADYERN